MVFEKPSLHQIEQQLSNSKASVMLYYDKDMFIPRNGFIRRGKHKGHRIVQVTLQAFEFILDHYMAMRKRHKRVTTCNGFVARDGMRMLNKAIDRDNLRIKKGLTSLPLSRVS